MWVSKLELTNIRSFEKADIVLSKGINILVGPNNAGKSTLLNAALASLQKAGIGILIESP
jgi:DNA repair exonuclease SbcCD ATPase subunit